ncbi:MAG TPA: hypothetical protein VF868_12400 [Bacteroidia bacterium]|jgi:hypothetical protein
MKKNQACFLLFTLIYTASFAQEKDSIRPQRLRKLGYAIGFFLRPVTPLKEVRTLPNLPYHGNFFDESDMYKNGLVISRMLNPFFELSFTTKKLNQHILGTFYSARTFPSDPGPVAGGGETKQKEYGVYYEFDWTLFRSKSNSEKCNSPFLGVKALYTYKYLDYFLHTDDVNLMRDVSLTDKASLTSLQLIAGYKLIRRRCFFSSGIGINGYTFLYGKYSYGSTSTQHGWTRTEEKSNSYRVSLFVAPQVIYDINLKFGFKF